LTREIASISSKKEKGLRRLSTINNSGFSHLSEFSERSKKVAVCYRRLA